MLPRSPEGRMIAALVALNLAIMTAGVLIALRVDPVTGALVTAALLLLLPLAAQIYFFSREKQED